MGKLYVLNGPEAGRSFPLRDGGTFVGRSLDNEIRIEDKTVSRKHLRIVKRGDKYFITDLKSRNGTFFNGNYISPGREVEVEEGAPIAIGITVICLGEGCSGQMMPFLDSIEFTEETGDQTGVFVRSRDRINPEKLEFLNRVSDVLKQNLTLKETLEIILDHIFDLLRRIDRGAFILVDPETQEIADTIYRSNKPEDDATTVYCLHVVKRVMESRKPFVVSDAKIEESEFADTLEVLKIESVMCMPLICRSRVMGAIYLDSLERPYGFRAEDLTLFMDLSQRIALMIEDAGFSSQISKTIKALSDLANDS